MNEHFLYPAALHVSKEPTIIKTILGSCVSVCLFEPNLKFGGMNHYMLPYWNGQGLASPKYGNIAIEKLIERMLEMGVNKSSLKAKIFGGGKVIDTTISDFHIGERNIEVAIEMLAENRIPIIAQSVGGNNGRKILFETHSGNVMHKFVERTIT